MSKVHINVVKLRPDAVLPEYKTAGAAGADLHACIDEPITLGHLEWAVIPTGLAMEIPEGYEVQIRARSGMSIKNGISLINGIGTIDADYRGELGIGAINYGKEPFVIEPGMRIAQMVVAKYDTADWIVVEELSETERGAGGYGSTSH